MKQIIITLALLLLSGTAETSDDTVYQLQSKTGEDSWAEFEYYVLKSDCIAAAVEIANEQNWKLDRLRCVEIEMN